MSRRLFKELERSYGFDEVAIVPGNVTINPELDIHHNDHWGVFL